MRRLFVSTIVLALLFAGASATLASQSKAAGTRPATVTILHGLPRFTADVYINGELTLNGFQPEAATDPLALGAGKYDVAIRTVGASPDSDPALAATLTVKAGKNYSAIAHLTPDGQPTVTVFDNDVSPVPAGRARLVVRHVAQAAALDLRLDGRSVIAGVESAGQGGRLQAPGTYSVDAVVTGGGDALVSAVPLRLREGTETILYLIGSADGSTLDFMVQELADLSSPPADVLAGTGGDASDRFPTWAMILLTAAVAAAAWSVAGLVRGRSATSR